MEGRHNFEGETEERRDAAESRRRILVAARRLFAERGAASVSMHEVGREAGVGQGTLYRRFAHRGELCFALLAEGAQEFARRMGEVAGEESRPALARLEELLVGILEFNEENGELLLEVRGAYCGKRQEGRDNPFYRWLRLTVVGLLEEAQTAGEVGDLDTECVADLVISPLDIDLYMYQRRELRLTKERIRVSLRHLIFGGLRA